jgi:hypothetical protein
MNHQGIYFLLSGQFNGPHPRKFSRTQQKEIAMAAHGHTTTWETYIGVGRAPQRQGWYAQFKTWWAARQHARLANLRAQWDAKREAVHPFRADAAIDMVPASYTVATARALCELSL